MRAKLRSLQEKTVALLPSLTLLNQPVKNLLKQLRGVSGARSEFHNKRLLSAGVKWNYKYNYKTFRDKV